MRRERESNVALAIRSRNRLPNLPSSVSSPRDRYDDESYDDEGRYGVDQDAKDEDRGGFSFYPSWGWGGGWGLPSAARREGTVRSNEEAYEDASDDDGSLVDEGLITLLIVTGAVLFLIPEPATSAIGALLLFVGAVGWLVDWLL